MPRKPGLLNIESHLNHLDLIFDGLDKYGLCPIIEAEIAKARIINNALLAKAQAKKDKRNNSSKELNHE